MAANLMKNGILILFILTARTSAFAQGPNADQDLTQRIVLVRGFPDLTNARCYQSGKCNLSEVVNGTLGLSGSEMLTVIEDRGQTLFVALGQGTRPSSLVGEVRRSDVTIARLQSKQPTPAFASGPTTFSQLLSDTTLVLKAAHRSGYIRDREILYYLKAILGEISRSQFQPHPVPAKFLNICTNPKKPEAAWEESGQIYLCPVALAERDYGPHLLIHELAHVVRRQMGFKSEPNEECMADLIAMSITFAAEHSSAEMRANGWFNIGNYYAACGEIRDRFMAISKEIEDASEEAAYRK